MTVYCAVNYNSKGKLGKDATPKQWWDFNNGFTNVENGDPRELLARITDGNSFCPRHSHIHRSIVVKGKVQQTAYRHSLNWLPSSVAALDYDDGTMRMTQLQEHPIVANYATMGYTTVSHTPEHERFRIVFVAERPVVNPESWRKVMAALAWKFVGVDKTVSDVIKPYAGNPLASVYTFYTGRTIPIGALKDLVAEWEGHRKQSEESKRAVFNGADPTVEEIREILRYVPERMDYLDWIKALMAVHSVMPNEAGIQLCEEWSPGTEGEIARNFRCFDRGTRVSFGWLVSVAKNHGYSHRASRVIGSILSRGRGNQGWQRERSRT